MEGRKIQNLGYVDFFTDVGSILYQFCIYLPGYPSSHPSGGSRGEGAVPYSSELYAYVFDVPSVRPFLDLPGLRHGEVANYRTKTYKAGRTLEAEAFPIWNTQTEHRAARAHATCEAQRNVNERNSVRELTRRLNANFTPADLHVTLTYADGRLPDEITAQHDIVNFLRRVRYLRVRLKLPDMKYIYVIEYAGADGRRKRIHQHIVMSGMDRAAVKGLWEKGRARADELEPEKGSLEGLARYITKQPRKDKSWKRWKGSRNLLIPRPTVADKKLTKRHIEQLAADAETRAAAIFERLYPGYTLAECAVRRSDMAAGAYVYVKMYIPTPRRKPEHRMRS